ncbi:MAG: DUF4956 domain-containing protein [Lachnospiraceae bacterium]|nr:DUF4956 domain-containing protein [Lachnospiraceae bacterium]
MSKREILTWFTGNSESLSIGKIVFVLCVALIIGAVVFATYRITYTGVSYNARFNAMNVIIILITAVIMLMISSNIAISLGMVGALSIVRFRTAIKDPHDTAYIFWAIVEGLCVGAQIHKLAVISTIFIALVLIAFSLYTKMHNKYLIILRGDAELSEQSVMEALQVDFKRVRIRAINNRESSCEMTCEVAVNGELNLDLVKNLKTIEHVKSANWLLETSENIG